MKVGKLFYAAKFSSIRSGLKLRVTSLDHIKNKFGRIKNKKQPTGQLAWKEREKRGKGLPVAVCMALIVPFNVVSIF